MSILEVTQDNILGCGHLSNCGKNFPAQTGEPGSVNQGASTTPLFLGSPSLSGQILQ
ncbi:MAG: hypothetical protein F6K41_40140 [Symploca sp. SIO3E6]|nr:hypothetical protein [Caldora sp. SIO3E6]